MTLNQILKIFENFSKRPTSFIKTFSYSDPQKSKDKNIQYPLMVAIPSIQTITDNQVHCKINVLFLDRINPKDSKQIREVYSDMFNRCKLLKAYFWTSNVPELEINDVSFEPVGDEINTDFVSGWGSEIEIVCDYDPSICDDQLILDDDIIQIGNYNSCACSGSGITYSAGTNINITNELINLNNQVLGLDVLQTIDLFSVNSFIDNAESSQLNVINTATINELNVVGTINCQNDIITGANITGYELDGNIINASEEICLSGISIDTIYQKKNSLIFSAETITTTTINSFNQNIIHNSVVGGSQTVEEDLFVLQGGIETAGITIYNNNSYIRSGTTFANAQDLYSIFESRNNFRASAATPSMFTGTPKKAVIVFSTPFSNTNYAVNISGFDNRTFLIENKTASGFTINSQSATVLTGNTEWSAHSYR